MTTVEEIVAMAVFLSERSSHTTGQIIHVDGICSERYNYSKATNKAVLYNFYQLFSYQV